MGQQQLLLLVLGIVIVGLAVVVGIQAFGENQKKANADAMVNDGVRIASDAQAWVLKPSAFGGGNGSFADITFTQLGYSVESDGSYENLNGTYEIDQTGECIIITGESDNPENTVYIKVDGTGPGDIETVVNGTALTCGGSTTP